MILNNKESLFGVVENSEENKDYKGKRTETATVSVDNSAREISVDVDFSSILGDTQNSAYPGLQGKINRELILNLEQQLQAETVRAEESENKLKEYIDDVSWDIDVGDGRVTKLVKQETERAITAETNIHTAISQLTEIVEHNQQTTESALDSLSDNIDIQTQQLLNKINNASETLSKDIEDTREYLYDDIKHNKEMISDMNHLITDNKNELYQAISDVDTKIKSSLEESVTSLQNSDNLLATSIEELTTATEETTVGLQISIDNIKSKYARKDYVQQQLVEFTKLSKQVVDYVDIDTNTVLVDGIHQDPVDGVLYLVKSSTSDVNDVYKEYTTINSQLTLIGDTSTNLRGYATQQWVEERNYLTEHQDLSNYASKDFVRDRITRSSDSLKAYVDTEIDKIPEVDLTPYARLEQLPTKVSELENDSDYALKSDIPDVSSFIAEIPDEYVTESELYNKGYYTLNDIEQFLKNIKFIDGGTSSSLSI